MSLNYSIHVRCPCRGADGKPAGQGCPRLWRKDGTWNSKHGSAGFATRIPTTAGVRSLKRFGFTSKGDAKVAAERVSDLLKLAGADSATRDRVGDLIAEASKHGGQLPDVEDVRRRIGIGADPGAPGVTFREAWTAWLAGKKRLRQSARDAWNRSASTGCCLSWRTCRWRG